MLLYTRKHKNSLYVRFDKDPLFTSTRQCLIKHLGKRWTLTCDKKELDLVTMEVSPLLLFFRHFSMFRFHMEQAAVSTQGKLGVVHP